LFLPLPPLRYGAPPFPFRTAALVVEVAVVVDANLLEAAAAAAALLLLLFSLVLET